MALSSYDCTGRFVADPEYKFVGQEQHELCTFTLAVDRDKKNEDGSRDADFWDFVAWRSAAKCLRNCRKGDLITLSHTRPVSHNYTDKDGNKRRKVEFEVSASKSDIYFGSRRRDRADGTTQQPTPDHVPEADYGGYSDYYNAGDEETSF